MDEHASELYLRIVDEFKANLQRFGDGSGDDRSVNNFFSEFRDLANLADYLASSIPAGLESLANLAHQQGFDVPPEFFSHSDTLQLFLVNYFKESALLGYVLGAFYSQQVGEKTHQALMALHMALDAGFQPVPPNLLQVRVHASYNIVSKDAELAKRLRDGMPLVFEPIRSYAEIAAKPFMPKIREKGFEAVSSTVEDFGRAMLKAAYETGVEAHSRT